MFIVWYTSKDKNETVLATRKEVIPHRGQAFPCSEAFQTEIEAYPGCVPKKCGRYMSDKLVTNSEAETLLRLARNGIALGKLSQIFLFDPLLNILCNLTDLDFCCCCCCCCSRECRWWCINFGSSFRGFISREGVYKCLHFGKCSEIV